MYKLAIGFAALILSGCAYSTAGQEYASGSDVGGTGNIKYTHEDLGGGIHFLNVDAAPGMMETEGSIDQRMYQFALRFAGDACKNGFDFVDDPNMKQARSAGFMRRSRSYRFECRDVD